MKDRIYISIVDEEGSKQFNLHKVAKKIFFYSIATLFVLIVSGFLLMTYLMKQIQDISATKNKMIQNYKNTFYQNQDIKKNIDSKSQELIDITKRVDDLEDIVNLSKTPMIPFSTILKIFKPRPSKRSFYSKSFPMVPPLTPLPKSLQSNSAPIPQRECMV